MGEEFDVDKIIILKPRKSNGSYICPILYSSKNEKLTYTMTNARLIKTKPLQQRDEAMIYFKCKDAVDFICDLNAFIIETVKDKSKTWFNNEMNVELIDDYFTNTLVYDKKYGDLIRLKYIGDERITEGYIEKKVDIEITFNHIRFYKQKFVIECTVDKINEVCLLEEDSESDDEIEDVPGPTGEDLDVIIVESLELIKQYLEDLYIQKQAVEDNIIVIEKKKDMLESASDINEVIRICNDLESLCE